MPRVLTRQDIVKKNDRRFEDVAVPEWGEDAVVRLASMSGRARDEFLHDMKPRMDGNKVIDARGLRVRLLRETLVDEEGAPLFDEESITALSDKSAVIIDRLFDVAQRLNGLGDDAMAEMEKNS